MATRFFARLSGVGGGLLVACSLPPLNLWPLGILGFALLAWAIREKSRLERFVIGYLFSIAWLLPSFWWVFSFNWYGAVVLILIEALYLSCAVAFVSGRSTLLFSLGGTVVLAEWLREMWPFGGLPLGDPALGQASGPLLVLARLGGPLFLAMVEVTLGVCLAWFVSNAELRRRGVVVTSALIALCALSSFLPDGGPPTRRVSVAAVQVGGKRGETHVAVKRAPGSVFSTQIRFSAGIKFPTTHLQRLIVWPEDGIALGSTFRTSFDAEEIAQLARHDKASVAVGYTQLLSGKRFKNAVAGFSPRGRYLGSVEKVHRVPFGEYIPYRGFFSHLATVKGVPFDLIPASNDGVLETPAGPLGIMVCYEVFYSDRGQQSVAHGAQILFVATNTSSYATSQVPSNEVAADRLDAASFGRDLIQVAETGYSEFVTPGGNVASQSALSKRQVIYDTVSLRKGRTLYSETGDLPVLGVAMFLVLFAVFRRRYS